MPWDIRKARAGRPLPDRALVDELAAELPAGAEEGIGGAAELQPRLSASATSFLAAARVDRQRLLGKDMLSCGEHASDTASWAAGIVRLINVSISSS